MVGDSIVVISWVQKAVQTVKGWLGFENKADAFKVNYELLKLLRYGKKHGFFEDRQVKEIMSNVANTLSSEPQHKVIADIIPKVLNHSPEDNTLDQTINSYYATHSKDHLRDARWTRVYHKYISPVKYDTAVMLYNMGRILISENRYKEAVGRLEKAAKLAPNKHEWNYLFAKTSLEYARQLCKSEQFAQAEFECDNALAVLKSLLSVNCTDLKEIKQALIKAYILKCALCIKLGRPAEAIQMINESENHFQQQYKMPHEIELLFSENNALTPENLDYGKFYYLIAIHAKEILDETNAFHRAIESFEKISSKDTQVMEEILFSNLALAERSIYSKNWDQVPHYISRALSYYERIPPERAKEHKDSIAFLMELLGRHNIQVMDYSTAITYFRNASLFKPKKEHQEQIQKCYLAMGDIAFNRDDVEQAIQNYSQALKIPDPSQQSLTAIKLADCGDKFLSKNRLLAVEAYRMALPYLTQIADDRLFHIHQQLGIDAKEEAKFQEAIQHLEAARKLNNAHPQILEDLYLCYGKVGNKEKQIEIMEAQKKSGKQGPDHYVELAKSYWENKNYARALANYEAAEKASSRGKYQAEIYKCFKKLGEEHAKSNPVEALNYYKHALARAGSEDAELSKHQQESVAFDMILLGNAIWQTNRPAAIEAYEIALPLIDKTRTQTNISIAYRNQARLAMEQKKFDESIKLYKKAISFDPNEESLKRELEQCKQELVNDYIKNKEYAKALKNYCDKDWSYDGFGKYQKQVFEILSLLAKNGLTEKDKEGVLETISHYAWCFNDMVNERKKIISILIDIGNLFWTTHPKIAAEAYKFLVSEKVSNPSELISKEVLVPIYLNLAALAEEEKDLSEASRCYQEAVRLTDSKDTKLLIKLAQCQISQKKIEKALATYQTALALEPHSNELIQQCTQLQLDLASDYVKKGIHNPKKFQQELIAFIQHIKIAPYARDIQKALAHPDYIKSFIFPGEYAQFDKLGQKNSSMEIAQEIEIACALLEKAYDGAKNHLNRSQMPQDLIDRIKAMREQVRNIEAYYRNLMEESSELLRLVALEEYWEEDYAIVHTHTRETEITILADAIDALKRVKESKEPLSYEVHRRKRLLENAMLPQAWLIKAVEKIEQVYQLNPDKFFPAYNQLIQALIAIGDESSKIAAIKYYQEFKKKFPSAAIETVPGEIYLDVSAKLNPTEQLHGLMEAAILHVKEKRYAEALDQYEKSLKIASTAQANKIAEQILLIGDQFAKNENDPIAVRAYELAIPYFNQLSILPARQCYIYFYMAQNTSHQKDYDNAIHYYLLAIKNDSNPAPLNAKLAEIYFIQDKVELAIDAHQRGTGQRPIDVCLNLAAKAESEKGLAIAIKYYMKASEFNPRNDKLLIKVAEGLRILQRLEEASDYYRRAFELQPKNSEYQKLYLQNEQELGDRCYNRGIQEPKAFQQALKDFITFVKKSPFASNIQRALAYYKSRLGLSGEFGDLDNLGKKENPLDIYNDMLKACAIIEKAYDGKPSHMLPNTMPPELRNGLIKLRQKANALHQFYDSIRLGTIELIKAVRLTEHSHEFAYWKEVPETTNLAHVDQIMTQAKHAIGMIEKMESQSKAELQKNVIALKNTLQQKLSSLCAILQAIPHYNKVYELDPDQFNECYNHLVDAYMQAGEYAKAGKLYVSLKRRFPSEVVHFCDPEISGSLEGKLPNEDLYELRMQAALHCESKNQHIQAVNKYRLALTMASPMQTREAASRLLVLANYVAVQSLAQAAVDAYEGVLPHLDALKLSQKEVLPIFINLAQAYQKAGNDLKAIQYYQNALKIDSNNLVVISSLADAYDRQNDIESALIYHKKAYTEVLTHKSSEADVYLKKLYHAQIKVGDRYFVLGTYVRAKETLPEKAVANLAQMQSLIKYALESSPEAPKIQNALRGWLGFGGLKEELLSLERTSTHPAEVERAVLRATEILNIAYDGKKNHMPTDEMTEELRALMSALQKQVIAQQELQRQALLAPQSKGKSETLTRKAIEHYFEANKLIPNQYHPYINNLIEAYCQMGNYSDAVEQYNIFSVGFASENVVLNPKAYLIPLEKLEKENKLTEALKLVREALEIFPSEITFKHWLSNIYFRIGQTLFKKGNFAQSLDYCNKALDCGVKANADCYSLLGTLHYRCYKESTEFDQKAEHIRKAIEYRKEAADIGSNNASYQFEFGRIGYWHSDDHHYDILPYLQRAVKLSPKNIAYAYGLVMALNKRYENPSHAEVNKAGEHFKNIGGEFIKDYPEWGDIKSDK